MQWRQDLNEVIDLGDSVKFRVFAEGEGLSFSLDNSNFMEPNTEKNGVKGFDITVKKEGNVGQNFWVKEWGYLLIPNSTPAPAPTPPQVQGDKTIQLQIFQNCSNNDGVYFRVETIIPDRNTSSYSIEVINTGSENDAIIEKTGHNTFVIRNHDNHKNGFFKVIVSRGDCKPCVYESYSTTCNHEGDPTNCPDNQRNIFVVGGDKLLFFGETFKIEVKGNITCDNVTYNTNVTEIDKKTFQITGFPFKLHYQPSCGDDCHGWTEIYQQTS